MGKEKDLENKVKRFLKDNGCWYVKYWGGGGYTRSGVSDLLISCNGFFIAVELKSQKGKPTDLQIRTLRQIKKAGGMAILLYPKDLELFRNLILAIKNDRPVLVNAIMDVFEERMKEYE